jgi:hypothetical protein
MTGVDSISLVISLVWMPGARLPAGPGFSAAGYPLNGQDGPAASLLRQMNEVAEAVNRRDLDLLLAHGRFLEECFGRPALSIESDEPNDPTDGNGPRTG